MIDVGYVIVALVGYGLALVALSFAFHALSDAIRLLRAGADIDEKGLGRGFYYCMTLVFLVLAALAAAATHWILGSF